MCKSLTHSVSVLTYNSDFTGAWRPSSVLEACQEIAGDHSNLIGVGRENLLRDRLVWVLIRTEVEMDVYPHIGDTVEITTFHRPVRHWFFPRYFLFRDQKTGTVLGRSGTMWMLLDLETRKAVPPAQTAARMPDNSDMEPTIAHLPPQVQPLTTEPAVTVYRPQYTDMDVNAHVNNARYLDFCCNALGIDCMQKMQLRHFVINYNSEIRPDQEVRQLLRVDGNRFSFTGMRDAECCFDIAGELAPRA